MVETWEWLEEVGTEEGLEEVDVEGGLEEVDAGVWVRLVLG